MFDTEIFFELFVGRKDVVPERWRTRDNRVGYSPICRKRFTEKCPKVQCVRCDSPDFVPMSESLIRQHFSGRKVLGIYPMLDDGKSCRFVAGDFDNHDGNHDPEADVRKVAAVCLELDLPYAVFRSQSGKGFHGYVFFSEPVPAAKARAVYFALLDRAGVTHKKDRSNDVPVSSFDRLFPAQDSIPAGDFGNLIALPFIGFDSGNPRALTLDTLPEDQEDRLAETGTLAESDLDGLITEWGLTVSVCGGGYVPGSGKTFGDTLAERCLFIQHCRDNASTLSEPEWHAMISVLAREPGGPTLIHQFSQSYPNYSREETSGKIQHVLDSQRSHLSCRYLKTLHDCGQDCGVRNPNDLTSVSDFDPKPEITDDFEDVLCDNLSLIPAIDRESLDKIGYLRTHQPERYDILRERLKKIKGVSITKIENDLKSKTKKEKKKPSKKDITGLPFCFWYEDIDSKGNLKLRIRVDGIVSELEKMGVCNVALPEGVRLAIIRDNIIKLTDVAELRNMVLNDFYDQLPEKISENFKKSYLREILRSGIGRFISDSICDTFRKKELSLLRDTIDTTRLFFKNGYMEIKPESTEFRKYSEMSGMIYENMIMNRDFVQTDDYQTDFLDFCVKVTNDDPERLETLRSVLGWNVSGFNNPAYTRAVVWMDEALVESGNPSGGTGKNLLATCHKHCGRNIKVINACRMKPDSEFAFQTVSYDTHTVILDEVPANFDLMYFFSDITGGLTVEYKGKGAWQFEPEDNVCLNFITNTAIKGDSPSYSRRVFEVALSNYFSEIRTPHDVYGRLFFSDWDDDDWAGFYKFMIDSIQISLKIGNKMGGNDSNTKTIGLKKCLAAVGQEFYEFAENLGRDVRLDSDDIFSDYLSLVSSQTAAKLSKNKFSRMVGTYCKYSGLEFERRNYSKNGKTKVGYYLWANKTKEN